MDKRPIESGALNVTKFAGWGSAIAALVAVMVEAVQGLADAKWPIELEVAIIGFAAVALLSIAIVTAADLAARAYASAHVYSEDPAKQPIPASVRVAELESAGTSTAHERVDIELTQGNGHIHAELPS